MKIAFMNLIVVLLFSLSLFAKNHGVLKKQYLIVNIDSFSGNLCRTVNVKGNQIYVFNIRYKLNENYRSRIGDDADFMFTFYILPNKNLNLERIKKDDITRHQVEDLQDIKKKLLSSSYSTRFDLEPILMVNGKYFKFSRCIIYGQAFVLEEDSQYFPKYGAGSNRFELNKLTKPYSLKSIDSLRSVISKDSSAMVKFGTYVEDFYDKWFISKIDKQNKTLDFWISLKEIYDRGFSFGRVTSEIKYKIGVGVIDFKIIPFKTDFVKSYLDDFDSPVQFDFKEFISIKLLVN